MNRPCSKQRTDGVWSRGGPQTLVQRGRSQIWNHNQVTELTHLSISPDCRVWVNYLGRLSIVLVKDVHSITLLTFLSWLHQSLPTWVYGFSCELSLYITSPVGVLWHLDGSLFLQSFEVMSASHLELWQIKDHWKWQATQTVYIETYARTTCSTFLSEKWHFFHQGQDGERQTCV